MKAKFRVWVDGKPMAYEYLEDISSTEFRSCDVLSKIDVPYMRLSKEKERLLLNLMDMIADGQANRLAVENLVVEAVNPTA